MTVETLIAEFETLPLIEQRKFFVYLADRAQQLAPSKEERSVSDAEFQAALRKVMTQNRGLLHRLAQ